MQMEVHQKKRPLLVNQVSGELLQISSIILRNKKLDVEKFTVHQVQVPLTQLNKPTSKTWFDFEQVQDSWLFMQLNQQHFLSAEIFI